MAELTIRSAAEAQSNGHAHGTPAIDRSKYPKEFWAKPVLWKHIEGLLDAVAEPLRERIRRLEAACGLAPSAPQPGIESIAPVVARYIEQRLGPLEKLAYDLDYEALRYSGIWEPKTYKRGQAVTLNGGMWLCQETTDSRPGDGDSGWKLVVKSAESKRDRNAD